jgi:pimeloyl-ACP methyl ester carboxylesterase
MSSSINLARKTAQAGSTSVNYVEAGAGEALLYLHSTGGLRMSVAHRTLAEKCRVIAPELNGAAQPAQIIALLDALGIQKCNVMAHGSSAALALALAETHAGRLDSLILVAPTAIGVDATRAKGYSLGRDQPIPAERLWHGTPGATKATLADAASSEAARKRIAGIATPTLVLLGTRDPVISTNVGRVYVATMPKCFATMVYDAGHEVDLDRPEAVASICANFLANRESFVVNRDDGMINP